MLRIRMVLLSFAGALAACGDTLVDHRATDIQDDFGNACVAPDISCNVGGTQACVPEDATHCGACLDCTAGFVAPHPSAAAACLGIASPRSGTCGYQCTGGLLKCDGGFGSCCQAVAVAVGAAHTCAITIPDGAVSCWGANESGQVAGVPSGPVLEPSRRVATGAVAIAAGPAHTCVALPTVVQCWGRNLEGQAPASMAIPGVTALAAGLEHTCALVGPNGLVPGEVRCWGTGDAVGSNAGTPIGSGATKIAAGTSHACALLTNGSMRCWGANVFGQLGDGTTTASATPVSPTGLGPGVPLDPIVALAAGGDHTCATTDSPTQIGGVSNVIRCWGDLPGATFGLAEPQLAPGIPMVDGNTSVFRVTELLQVATGRTHTCVQRTSPETVSCFGSENALGQLGGTPVVPSESADAGPPGALALSAGGDHSCAISLQGGLRCWGSNGQGQLGDGTTVTPPVGTMITVSGR